MRDYYKIKKTSAWEGPYRAAPRFGVFKVGGLLVICLLLLAATIRA